MNFEFKKFEGRNVRLETRITVTKSFSIGFPSKFFADNKIGDYKFVVLFWDENSKAIGIKFTNDEAEKSKFSIIRSQAGYGGSVVARSFFKAYSIDPKKYYGRYDWKKHNIEGVGEIYAIELKERVDIPV
jgi:hypothetical protein